jgi:hypothetical protein
MAISDIVDRAATKAMRTIGGVGAMGLGVYTSVAVFNYFCSQPHNPVTPLAPAFVSFIPGLYIMGIGVGVYTGELAKDISDTIYSEAK